jgi:hypothetical protein
MIPVMARASFSPKLVASGAGSASGLVNMLRTILK